MMLLGYIFLPNTENLCSSYYKEVSQYMFSFVKCTAAFILIFQCRLVVYKTCAHPFIAFMEASSCNIITDIYITVITLRWGEVSVELWLLTGQLSIPQMIHEWIWSFSRVILTGKNWRTCRKACHSATLSIINPTWTALGANLGLCGEKPATNRRCYVRAGYILYII
jgi:hypothetical protein